MNADDDIAASLPRAPTPSPAKKAAAIDEAMRRFDGGEPRAASRSADPAPSRSWFARPAVAGLTGVTLAAVLTVSFAWNSIGIQPDRAPRQVPADETRLPNQAIQETAQGPSKPTTAPQPGVEEKLQPETQIVAPASKAPDAVETAPVELAMADRSPVAAAPPPPPVAEAAPAVEERRVAKGLAASGAADQDVVVTAARRQRDDEDDSSSVGEIVVTSTKSRPRKADQRGDWNACTINDPGQSLSDCSGLLKPARDGMPPNADSRIAQGLGEAWNGNLNGAIASFGRAIEAAPRSSFAYLNRGLAHWRQGDLDAAMADLDRAVRFGPAAARNYYNRSLLLRERGQTKRADSDARRAVSLNARYSDLEPER